jgi:hypothetical protein
MFIDIERALPSFEVVYEVMFGKWYEDWRKWNDNAANPFTEMISTIEEPSSVTKNKEVEVP